jgi:hypothetical protein
MRECEVCGKNDIDTNVRGSSIGPFSMNYCLVCSSLAAEGMGILDAISDGDKNYFRADVIYYDKDSDTYKYYKNDKEVVLRMTSGLIFSKRSEAVKHLKEI